MKLLPEIDPHEIEAGVRRILDTAEFPTTTEGQVIDETATARVVKYLEDVGFSAFVSQLMAPALVEAALKEGAGREASVS